MRLAVLICGIVMLMPFVSHAEDAAKKPLYVLIEDLDPDAQRCGIQKSSLESIAALTLRTYGLKAAGAATNPYLYVNTIVFPLQQGSGVLSCAAALRVSVEAVAGQMSMNGFKARSTVSTPLCGKTGLYVGSVYNFSGQLSNGLEQQLKICLGDVEY
jgi:hypothetical protein